MTTGVEGRIAVTGSVAFDHIMVFAGRFRDHILAGETRIINVAFLVESLERRRGGTAANICYTLALLGESPLLCAAVGAADFDPYEAALTAAGVDTSAVLRCAEVGTASAFITTDLDSNQITAFHAGAMARAGEISLSQLADVSHVVVGADASDAMVRHVADARSMGARLVYAPAQQIPAMDDQSLRDGLHTAWLVVGNDYEMKMITGRTGITVSQLRERCIVAVTRGALGSELHHPGGVITLPAAPAAQLVDPTGAGDAYIAGLVAGLRAGFDLSGSGRLAAVVASFAVEHRGPQSHRFTDEQLDARHRAAFGEPPPDWRGRVRRTP